MKRISGLRSERISCIYMAGLYYKSYIYMTNASIHDCSFAKMRSPFVRE